MQDITGGLEDACLRKLSLDAQLALEKFAQVNHDLQLATKENARLNKQIAQLRENLRKKQMRLEVAEALLCEMLKQMQRKYNQRKDCAAQVNVQSR